jgi:ferredoxin-NADP reductase
MNWLVATVVELRDESATARTLGLSIPAWTGHVAGQHVDVRLTAPDGYSAARSYSIASAPGGERIELTVETLADGEVSPYLTRTLEVGDALEVRGPIGGWFVWKPAQSEPVQLVAGGSGIVPLMAMARTRIATRSTVPFRLLYSVRAPDALLYGTELERYASADDGITINYAYTRATPPGWPRPAGRIDADLMATQTFPPSASPTCYVCGPTAFVERVADALAAIGHDVARIRTERFGPSGGVR